MADTNKFYDAGGHEAIYQALALAKVVESKILHASKDQLDAAFSRNGDWFEGEDMVGLCNALRSKMQELAKIAEATE